MRRPSAFRFDSARRVSIAIAFALGACASDHGHGHRYGGHRPDGAPPQPRERVFLGPMGEPFRAAADAGDPERAWFDGADANHDGQVTLAEFQADAARFFATLDVGRDGEIDPADLERYETVVAPEVRSGSGGMGGARGGGSGQGGGRSRGGGMGHGGGGGMGGGGGGRRGGGNGEGSSSTPQATEPVRQGAGRYSYLDIPEPVIAADTNMNRGIDINEFAAAAAGRFRLLDRNGDGVLIWAELPHVRARPGGMRGPGGGGHRGPPAGR
ncbi:EF-hand domain-containing protein [uncultured Sphingomonas sp.]|uniref:EF-hand domain-containing protein n=1 Tax=uncultured Sphingomonas sp. TaxID=158754 RepID=UPI0035CB7387